jgi:hypothetical protein
VLNVTKEALHGVPLPGVKAAVAGLSETLKIFQVGAQWHCLAPATSKAFEQTKWGNDKALMEFKKDIQHVLEMITSCEIDASGSMKERLTRLRE